MRDDKYKITVKSNPKRDEVISIEDAASEYYNKVLKKRGIGDVSKGDNKHNPEIEFVKRAIDNMKRKDSIESDNSFDIKMSLFIRWVNRLDATPHSSYIWTPQTEELYGNIISRLDGLWLIWSKQGMGKDALRRAIIERLDEDDDKIEYLYINDKMQLKRRINAILRRKKLIPEMMSKESKEYHYTIYGGEYFRDKIMLWKTFDGMSINKIKKYLNEINTIYDKALNSGFSRMRFVVFCTLDNIEQMNGIQMLDKSEVIELEPVSLEIMREIYTNIDWDYELFTIDAVEKIYNLSMGNVREFKKICKKYINNKSQQFPISESVIDDSSLDKYIEISQLNELYGDSKALKRDYKIIKNLIIEANKSGIILKTYGDIISWAESNNFRISLRRVGETLKQIRDNNNLTLGNPLKYNRLVRINKDGIYRAS